MDECSTFDEHAICITTQAHKNLGILSRAKEYLENPTKILLYEHLLHLDYCDIGKLCTTEQNPTKYS